MVTIGLVGHVDAGKSTLVKLLSTMTYVDRQVGRITQDVKCVLLDREYLDRLCGAEGSSVLLVDVPGHTAYRTSRAISVAVADVVAVIIELGRKVPRETIELVHSLESIPYCIIFTKFDLFSQPRWLNEALGELLQEGLYVQHYRTRREGKPYFLSGLDRFQQVVSFLKFCRRIKNLAKKFMYLQSVIAAGRTLGVFLSRGYSTDEIKANGHVSFEKFFADPYGTPKPIKEISDGLWGAKFEGRLEPGTELNRVQVPRRRDGLVVKSSSEARLAALLSVLKKEQIPVMYAAVGPVTKTDLQCAKTAGPCNRAVVAFNVKGLRHPLVLEGALIHQLVAAVKGTRLKSLREKIHSQFGTTPVTCIRPVPGALFFQDATALIAGFQVLRGSLQVGMEFVHGSASATVESIELDGRKVAKGSVGTKVGICFKPHIPHEVLYEKSVRKVFGAARTYMPGLSYGDCIEHLIES